MTNEMAMVKASAMCSVGLNSIDLLDESHKRLLKWQPQVSCNALSNRSNAKGEVCNYVYSVMIKNGVKGFTDLST